MKNSGHKSKESSFNGVMNYLLDSNVIQQKKEVSQTKALVVDEIHKFLKSENLPLINKRDWISNQKNAITVQKNWQKFTNYVNS